MSKQIKALMMLDSKIGPALKSAVANQLRTIATRLRDGVDASGEKFTPYQEDTKSRKKYKDGRTPLSGFAEAVVDLPIRIETTDSGVSASAQLDGELGKPATYQNLDRHFMGYSSQDAKGITKSVVSSIGGIVRRANK